MAEMQSSHILVSLAEVFHYSDLAKTVIHTPSATALSRLLREDKIHPNRLEERPAHDDDWTRALAQCAGCFVS